MPHMPYVWTKKIPSSIFSLCVNGQGPLSCVGMGSSSGLLTVLQSVALRPSQLPVRLGGITSLTVTQQNPCNSQTPEFFGNQLSTPQTPAGKTPVGFLVHLLFVHQAPGDVTIGDVIFLSAESCFTCHSSKRAVSLATVARELFHFTLSFHSEQQKKKTTTKEAE